uniref:Uncharacterized protein n=1 Tax=Oryza barthii TaxID=65489 RepID=A0A0D3FUN6_9ORYZ
MTLRDFDCLAPQVRWTRESPTTDSISREVSWWRSPRSGLITHSAATNLHHTNDSIVATRAID